MNKSEKSSKAWAYRILLGWAILLDGIISIISLGYISFGFALKIARRLAIVRYNRSQND